MRILDLLKKGTSDVFKKELLLDESAQANWSRLLNDHYEIDAELKKFTNTLEELKSQIRTSTKKFTDDDALAAIPDRARTINAIHGKEYAQQVEKLLAVATFPDIFQFDEQQERYFEANNACKSASAKHVSVLKEFMHDELKVTQGLLQQLEDAIIGFMKILEERKFPTIRKLHETNKRMQHMAERQEKYEKLLASLRTDLKHTQEKRSKIEEEIKTQAALVRNEQAQAALGKMKQLEEDVFHTAQQYNTLAKDLHTLYNKHSELAHSPVAKKAIAELQKDAGTFLMADAEAVKVAFEEITQQLEEANLGNRNLFERLARLAGAAEADGRRIATSGPDLRALKKDIMKDVAALQIYDKQQFLMRAQAEENGIQMKITYIEQELDPTRQLTMEREMKDLAKSLGAIIKPREPKTAEQPHS